MNAGGMFQLDEGADQCPHCGAEPDEVFPLSPEAYKRSMPRLEQPPAGNPAPAVE